MRRRAVAQEIDGMGRECAPSPSALAAAGRIIALGLVTEPVPATPSASEQRIAALEAGLLPFADLAVWIAENRPSFDGDGYEVQIERWPYTLSVGWLRRARALIAGEDGRD